jgi:hydrogenase maturation protein HypF
MTIARCTIDVRGLVQGVGFRPFVHGLARAQSLSGVVYNDPGGVHIEVEGKPSAIERFVRALRDAPPPAEVEEIACREDRPRGDTAFRIVQTKAHGPVTAAVPADVATCDDCLRELFDPENRRAGHPFISCAHCGPRATIIRAMPYDRERTTMDGFAMCARCREEYDAPLDRRFHAQPIACRECGPTLSLFGPDGAPRNVAPLQAFAAQLAMGGIGALKGVGGFHLLCDAGDERSVLELRRRKGRDAKPFAVMVPDLASAERIAVLDDAARATLASPVRPIVVVERRPGAPIAPAVAPGLATVGVLLAYAPVHHLLFAQLGGRPLVATSGNVSDEPIASTDAEALSGLSEIADVFLSNDRPIHARADDSVVRSVAGRFSPIRRARGMSPQSLSTALEWEVPTLALGGHLKAAFALGIGRSAIIGPHFGDLDGLRNYESWTSGVRRFEALHAVTTERLVSDLHPDYASTRYAFERLAAGDARELVLVQHHHAHMASCMAENRLAGDVIGVCFDGLGLGPDGGLWGGEFLVGGYARFRRAAHLAEVELPGGDRAAREPYRSAVAHLCRAELPLDALARRVGDVEVTRVERLARSGACPRTSSMGRLFDAAAAITGVLDRAVYEGQAGMLLEALAASERPDGAYDAVVRSPEEEGAPLVVETAPLVRGLAEDVARGTPPSRVARRFHSAVVELVLEVCERLRMESGLARVVLSGGVFANALLGREVPERLAKRGFAVFVHGAVPPNDGGLCLGQLAVAAHGGGVVRRRASEGAN